MTRPFLPAVLLALATAGVAVVQGEPAWLLPVAVAALAAGDLLGGLTRRIVVAVAVTGGVATLALVVGGGGQAAVPVVATITCAAAVRRRSLAPAVLGPAAAAVTAAVVLLPAGRFLPLALVGWSAAAVGLLASPDRLSPLVELGTPRRSPVLVRVLTTVALLAVCTPLVAALIPDPPGRGDPRLGAGEVDEGPGPPVASGSFRSTDRIDLGVRSPVDDREVLRVRAERPSLWRGQVFDRWDGRTWTLAPGLVDRDRVTARTEFEAANRFGIDLEEQRMTVVEATDVVVAAPRLVDHATPVRAQRDRDGTILTDRPMPPGTTYRVTSAVLKISVGELEAAVAGGADPGERYRVLPAVPERIVTLARELTAGAPTTLAKVRSIEAWLAANITYTLDLPPLPAGADAVDHVLFEDRRGYCQQIASAMAVLLRIAGVPTRVATGVVAGERDELSGEWIVRAQDAHAWVEVWFPGIGWYGFDPTSAVPFGSRDGAGSALADALAAAVPGLVIAMGALAIAGAVVSARRARRRRPGWARRQVDTLDRLSGAVGRPRSPSTPVRRHVADGLAGSPLDHPDLPGAVAVVERALYTDDEPAPTERRFVEVTLADLRREARPRWRRRPWDRPA